MSTTQVFQPQDLVLGFPPGERDPALPRSLDEALGRTSDPDVELAQLTAREAAAAPEQVAPAPAPSPGHDPNQPAHPQAQHEVRPVAFQDLGGGMPQPVAPRELRILSDIQLELSVELGRARMSLRQLLALSPGTVIELERLAGEPVDVLVNGRTVARGEVVVVDEDFGVRIIEIVDRPR